MNQKEYYEVSTSLKLPMRCPILNYCERRAFTIFQNSDYRTYLPEKTVFEALRLKCDIPEDFLNKKIDVQGESPEWIGGRNSFWFSHLCPEVNLFDSSNSLISNTAAVEGSYDNERITNKMNNIKCQHYSVCPEFNKYLFDRNQKTTPNKKKRKTIPNKTKVLLQKEIKSKCPFCLSEEVEHFHIHHINEDPENNSIENLIMICPTCHSKITKNDISYDKVKELKNKLLLI